MSWQIDPVYQAVAITLEGRVEPGTYMAFGLSGSDTSSAMIGSDVAVAWIDQQTEHAQVQDYYLNSQQQVSYRVEPGTFTAFGLSGSDTS